MDLSDDAVKRDLSTFISHRKQLAGLTNEKLAQMLGWSLKSVQRYMAMKAEGSYLPHVIPDKTYVDLLAALGATHEEFQAFRASTYGASAQDNSSTAPAQSTGRGSLTIGSIQISGNAQLSNSPIGTHSVTYNIGTPADEGRKR